MSSLRIAVIGAGHLGRIHARLLSRMDGVALIGVVDPDENCRSEVAATCQTQGFAQASEIADLDAAVVAAPTRIHHRVAMELIQRGVHVLVEKPIATSLAEADEMVAAARRAGVVLQVGHVERFNPVMRLVEPRLAAPDYIDATRCGSYTFRSTDIGVVLDLMIHDIDLALWLVKRPVRKIEAIGFSVFGGHEDLANARIEFDGGCVATLSASRVSYQAERRMQVFSDRGMATIDFAARTATLVGVGARVRQGALDVDALSAQEKADLKERLFEDLLPLERIVAPEGNALADELADFADSIAQLRAPRVDGEQGRAALAVTDQILDAIRAHRWDGKAPAPEAAILQGPHWNLRGAQPDVPRREAG